MSLFDLGSLTPQQRHTVIASFLGWMQDAFDFFILIFVVALLAGFGAEAKGIAFGRQREGSRSRSRRSPTPPDAMSHGNLNVRQQRDGRYRANIASRLWRGRTGVICFAAEPHNPHWPSYCPEGGGMIELSLHLGADDTRKEVSRGASHMHLVVLIFVASGISSVQDAAAANRQAFWS